MTDEKAAEIAAIRAAFEQAENEGDPSVQASFRDPTDYRRMPPGRPPMDAEMADESLSKLYEQTALRAEWESDGVLVDGDLAVDSGTFMVEIGAPDPEVRRGSWLLVFRRSETGGWRVVRDIYNYHDRS